MHETEIRYNPIQATTSVYKNGDKYGDRERKGEYDMDSYIIFPICG